MSGRMRFCGEASLLALALSVNLVLGACRTTSAAHEADPVRVAEAVLERLGGREAWAATRHVHFRFFGRREHWWDRHTGDARIETDGLVVLFNVHTLAGRAFEDGTEVLAPTRRRELVERAWAWWVNDTYWMFMPYKLLDPGVRLRDLGFAALADGRAARELELTFEDAAGLTPENRYVVRVGAASGLVEEWTFYTRAEDETPRFTKPWSGWKRFGRVLLATDHGSGQDWDVWVAETLDSAVYGEL